MTYFRVLRPLRAKTRTKKDEVEDWRDTRRRTPDLRQLTTWNRTVQLADLVPHTRTGLTSLLQPCRKERTYLKFTEVGDRLPVKAQDCPGSADVGAQCWRAVTPRCLICLCWSGEQVTVLMVSSRPRLWSCEFTIMMALLREESVVAAVRFKRHVQFLVEFQLVT